MSELLDDDYSLPTGEVIGHVQSVLQRFVEKPEGYALDQIDLRSNDAFRACFDGLGTVLLSYNRRSQAHVSFTADAGFEVNVGYRLHAGIWVEPMPLNQSGGLDVRYRTDDNPDGLTYYPRIWRDGGISLEAPKRGTLHWHVVDQIGRVVSALPEPVIEPPRAQLKAVE
jgi:hypothetical protein